MKSMTGFGTSMSHFKGSSGNIFIEVTIRTVNGRFLEPRFHLPREYMAYESELKKKLQSEFQRGTVDIYVSRKTKTIAIPKVKVNEDLALQYHKAIKTLAKKLKTSDVVDTETLLRFPEVLLIESETELQSEVSSKEEKTLYQIFDKSLESCLKERVREGESLRKELLKLLKSLSHELSLIADFREKINETLQEKYLTKIRAKLKGTEVDAQRLSQEIVIQVDKSDINEELSRLFEHIKNYQLILSSEHAEGKKLDFYTQELLREMNTIGSKSQLVEVTQAVVQCKTLIERLREQVQNVE